MPSLKIGLLIACFSTAFLSQFAQAKIIVTPMPTARQVPSDASLQQLMQVLKFDNALNEQLEQAKMAGQQAIQQTLKSTLQTVDLTPSQLQQIEQATNELLQKVINEQNRPELRQNMIKLYQATLKDNYSQAEVDAMITFYGSPIGQSIINKQTIVNQSYARKVMPIMIETTQLSMKKFLPNYQQRVLNITQSPQQKVKK